MSPCQHSHMNELRNQGVFCDTVIKVGNRSFSCHRIVLASTVAYFRTMFTQNYSEQEQKEIVLNDISADDFELLLTRVYGGVVSLQEGNNAYRLLRISQYLHLERMEDLCKEYTAKSDTIPLDTVIHIYVFACKIGEKSLQSKFGPIIAENFDLASTNESFLLVSGADLLKVLQEPCLKASTTAILDYLGKWMLYQSEENRKLLPDLLRKVDCGSVSVEWLVKIMMENSSKDGEKMSGFVDFHEDFEIEVEGGVCQEGQLKLPFILYTHDSLNELYADSNLYKPGTHVNRYKFENTNSVCMLDFNFIENTDEDQYFDMRDISFWKSVCVDNIQYIVTNLPGVERNLNEEEGNEYTGYLTPFVLYKSENHLCSSVKLSSYTGCYDRPSVLSSGHNIYAHHSGLLHSYDCKIDEWMPPRELLLKTTNSNLVSYNGTLYVVGGKCYDHSNCESAGQHFLHYDPREGKSGQLPDMIYTHIAPASYVYNNILYVTGGQHMTQYKGYMEYYDFKAGKWNSLKTSMPTPMFAHIMFTYENKLWFFGGDKCVNIGWYYSHNLSWYFYDLNKSEWSDISSVPSNVDDRFTITKIFDVVIDL